MYAGTMTGWPRLLALALGVAVACTPEVQSPPVSASSPHGEAVAPADRPKTIDRDLPARMAHYQVPGVSLAIIENYEIVFAKGYGVLDNDSRAPVTTESLFHASSIS